MDSARDENTIYTNIEIAAEEVAEAKHLLVELDRRQHQYREAKRALMKQTQNAPTSNASFLYNSAYAEDTYLLCSGGTFIASGLSPADTLRYLQWKEQQGEEERERATADLKLKVAALAELEGPDSALSKLYEGFDLKPV